MTDKDDRMTPYSTLWAIDAEEYGTWAGCGVANIYTRLNYKHIFKSL